MPSQPDYTRAYQLSPELKPRDLSDELADANATIASLTAELAKLKGTTPEEVKTEQEQANLPPAVSPLPTPATPTTEAPVEATRQDAQFFASKEGKKFYPIAELEKSEIKPENLRFFRTEREALDASYTA